MKVSISFLHNQSSDWLRELAFYKEEIALLTNRLGEVVSKNTSQEVTAQAEHFQNKFILMRRQVDELIQNAKDEEQRVEQIAKERPNHISEKFVADNEPLHQQMKDLTKSFADTRFEFNRFLAKVM